MRAVNNRAASVHQGAMHLIPPTLGSNRFNWNKLIFQVLYRLKEKVQLSDIAVKAPPPGHPLSPPAPLDSAKRSKGTKVNVRNDTAFSVTFNVTWIITSRAFSSVSIIRKHGPSWAPSSCSHIHPPAAANRSLPPPRSSCYSSAQVSQCKFNTLSFKMKKEVETAQDDFSCWLD